jgi:hypothetical protein
LESCHEETRTLLLAVLLSVSVAVPAVASEKQKKTKQPSRSITLSEAQFMRLLEMAVATNRPAAPAAGVDGKPGEQGKPGADGQPGAAGPPGVGERGQDGAAGAQGVAGRDGVDGQPGAAGRDGVGFEPGAVFLVNGACPGGTTVQGAQNRWTVYANDTNGRPWTETGSSAQLFLSACQVD